MAEGGGILAMLGGPDGSPGDAGEPDMDSAAGVMAAEDALAAFEAKDAEALYEAMRQMVLSAQEVETEVEE